MKIIREPSVYVVMRPSLDDNQLARFLKDNGTPEWESDAPCDAQAVIEFGGRVCYDSFRGGRPHNNYLKHIIESGHGSVIEHSVWGFLFTGISRNLSLELIRHRAGTGVSQRSQRYCAEDDAAFVVPVVIADNPELLAAWTVSVERSQALICWRVASPSGEK